jgi:RNA polymerase sigma-70 factor (ECF subfamily)
MIKRTPNEAMPKSVSHAPTAGPEEPFADLVRGVAAGERDALERLLMESQALAYRFSVLVCGNVPDAEDAMQDALLQTYRRASHIREPRAFRTWLYRTVKNACLMSRRPRAKEPPRLLSLDDEDAPTVATADPGPEELVIRASDRRRFDVAFRTLPKHYRLVVFLRDIEGLSTAEVAQVVGISEDNVKQRLHRGRMMLKESLA